MFLPIKSQIWKWKFNYYCMYRSVLSTFCNRSWFNFLYLCPSTLTSFLRSWTVSLLGRLTVLSSAVTQKEDKLHYMTDVKYKEEWLLSIGFELTGYYVLCNPLQVIAWYYVIIRTSLWISPKQDKTFYNLSVVMPMVTF